LLPSKLRLATTGIISEHLGSYQEEDRHLEERAQYSTTITAVVVVPELYALQPWTARILGFDPSADRGFEGGGKQSEDFSRCIEVFRRRSKIFQEKNEC
jgi:hypothetical protein